MRLIYSVIFLMILAGAVQAEERYIVTSDSVRLYVNVKGSGPACLYIHGGPGSGSFWMEEFMGDMLEQNFRMIYLDQRGEGRSSSPVGNNFSMKRMIQDFEEVRKALNIPEWLTLGHSFGGLLQMGYVSEKPNVIKGMLMINCTLSMNDSFSKSWLPKAIELAGDATPALCRDTTIPIFRRMMEIMPVLGEKEEMWKIFFNRQENSGKMNATYQNFDSWNSDQSEKIMEVEDYWRDFSILTPKVKQPVLLYYGKTDWAVGPEHYKMAAFPKMMLWGSDAGHMPFLEDKPDLVNAIKKFTSKYLALK